MSENLTTKIKTFKSGAIIDIQVGDGFYNRVQQLFLWYAQQDMEKAVKTIELLKIREPQEEFEEHLLTLLSLIYEIESKAMQQGLLQDTEIKLPNP